MSIDRIINEVEEMHPYKKAGDRDSYSKYAEGWSDACDILGERIKQYLRKVNQYNSENANCVSVVLPTDSNITQTCTIDSIIVRCDGCGYEKKADKNIKYGDIGKPPEIAALGKISNCPKCSELYGYMWLKWYDREGNAL